MTEALLKLIDLVIAWWHALTFWHVLPAEDIGFVRRFGKYARPLKPGLNLRWPIVESAETCCGQEGIYVLDPQSLRTADDVTLVLRASVTFKITDARRYHLEAWGALENIRDLVAGELGDVVRASDAADVYSGKAVAKALTRARTQARKWGIQLIRVRCADLSKSRSLRLWQTQTTAEGQH